MEYAFLEYISAYLCVYRSACSASIFAYYCRVATTPHLRVHDGPIEAVVNQLVHRHEGDPTFAHLDDYVAQLGDDSFVQLCHDERSEEFIERSGPSYQLHPSASIRPQHHLLLHYGQDCCIGEHVASACLTEFTHRLNIGGYGCSQSRPPSKLRPLSLQLPSFHCAWTFTPIEIPGIK